MQAESSNAETRVEGRVAAKDDARVAHAGASDAELRAAFDAVKLVADNYHMSPVQAFKTDTQFAQAFIALAHLASERGARVSLMESNHPAVGPTDTRPYYAKRGGTTSYYEYWMRIEVIPSKGAKPILSLRVRRAGFGAHATIERHGGGRESCTTIVNRLETGYSRIYTSH